MERWASRSLALGALLVLAGSLHGAEVVPAAPQRHFDDRAGFVSADAARRLDEALVAFETRTGHQLVVSIFPSLPTASLEDFTVRTAQAWRVGGKQLDDGLVLFVFVKERKLRIEVGYGLEANLPDAKAKRIIDDVITPELRAGRAADGLEAGLSALMAAAEGREVTNGPVATLANMPPAEPASAPPPTAADGLLRIPLIYTVGCFALLTMLIRFAAIRRRVRRGESLLSAWLAETVVVLSYLRSSSGMTYSSGGHSSGSGSSGGFSGGGGSFGGGGASGSW
jgi:uncharacterized protein